MKKQELFDAFEGVFSKSCIKKADGEPGHYHLVGKLAVIEPMDDGTLDVWVGTPGDLSGDGLGTRKINNITAALCEHMPMYNVRVYDGEMSFTSSFEDVIQNADVIAKTLRIRKARKLTPEQLYALRKRMATTRNAA